VVGGALSFVILLLRRWIPESPRWLMTHGRPEEADRVVRGIEETVEARQGPLPPPSYGGITLHRRDHVSIGEVVSVMFHRHRDRSILALTLMACQAFCYNAIFFTYALVLTRFYGVANEHVGWYILPFAFGNLMGPLLLGHLFDSVGRRPMITATYAISGILLALTGFAFAQEWLGAAGQTAAWTVIFFFASAAASAAYLTVGEAFPLEMRAMGIAVFYAFGTGIGGVVGPALFGWLIEGGARTDIMWGYLFGAALMLVAAGTEWRLGFAAERRPLEEVSEPVSARPR
jgi:MFS family permease